MSIIDKTEVTCPKCGKKGPFTIWPSLNTTLNPDKKAEVLDGSLFMYECPACGCKAPVEYGFLYHQMDDKIMIHVDKTMSSFEDRRVEDLMGMLSGSDYLIRVVPDTNSLREKIHIFDDGLDDRVIELVKVMILIYMAGAQPEYLSAPGGCSLYYIGEDGVKKLLVYADGQPEGSIDITKPYEETQLLDYVKGLPPLRKSGPVIDRAWAAERMRMTEALKEMGCL